MNISKEKQEKIAQFLKHSGETGESLEQIRKRLIAAIETAEQSTKITQNSLYETYLSYCQKRGELTNTLSTVLQQKSILANTEFLQSTTENKTRLR